MKTNFKNLESINTKYHYLPKFARYNENGNDKIKNEILHNNDNVMAYYYDEHRVTYDSIEKGAYFVVLYSLYKKINDEVSVKCSNDRIVKFKNDQFVLSVKLSLDNNQ